MAGHLEKKREEVSISDNSSWFRKTVLRGPLVLSKCPQIQKKPLEVINIGKLHRV